MRKRIGTTTILAALTAILLSGTTIVATAAADVCAGTTCVTTSGGQPKACAGTTCAQLAKPGIPRKSAPTVTRPTPGTDRLPSGTILHPGQSIFSGSGYVQLIMQSDGNLVMYHPGGPIWATGTRGSAQNANFAYMQGDGNLVVYGPNGPLWATGTSGSNFLVVQSDENLVMYGNAGGARWASNTWASNSPYDTTFQGVVTHVNVPYPGTSPDQYAGETGCNGTAGDRKNPETNCQIWIYPMVAGYADAQKWHVYWHEWGHSREFALNIDWVGSSNVEHTADCVAELKGYGDYNAQDNNGTYGCNNDTARADAQRILSLS